MKDREPRRKRKIDLIVIQKATVDLSKATLTAEEKIPVPRTKGVLTMKRYHLPPEAIKFKSPAPVPDK